MCHVIYKNMHICRQTMGTQWRCQIDIYRCITEHSHLCLFLKSKSWKRSTSGWKKNDRGISDYVDSDKALWGCGCSAASIFYFFTTFQIVDVANNFRIHITGQIKSNQKVLFKVCIDSIFTWINMYSTCTCLCIDSIFTWMVTMPCGCTWKNKRS
jgi:hypothetical protein